MKGKLPLAVLLTGLMFLSLYAAACMVASPSGVLDQVNSIIEQVQEIRGLHFKEKPKIVIITKAQALAMWKPGKPDLERLREEEMIYKMTLLLPPDYEFIKEEREQGAGWIAMTVGDTIYIIKENFFKNRATAERTIAHELTHVLQKQWFNARYGANTSDGTLAVKALVEGDADLVADIYCERNGIPIHKIRSLSGDPITDLNIFPYVYGDPFVRYLYKKGGWKLVNSAYSHYPDSTLEIMLPELYLENFTPDTVRADVPNGSKVLWNDRLGAFYVYVLLKDVAKLDSKTAWNVSTAWRGDRLILAANGTDYILVWRVIFSSKEAAMKFGETLEKLARGNDYATYTIIISGREVTLKAVRGMRNEA
ncbi:DUF4157 domain-containing protein [Thermococcus sp.]|uniref:eCIS core domain-containing protein n=1 Tax=Thermococcus sp. TaxID=35749 RepID=UPI00261D92A0|nr:DUF4157 domain-containing protein [Thermococcus sp.]